MVMAGKITRPTLAKLKPDARRSDCWRSCWPRDDALRVISLAEADFEPSPDSLMLQAVMPAGVTGDLDATAQKISNWALRF